MVLITDGKPIVTRYHPFLNELACMLRQATNQLVKGILLLTQKGIVAIIIEIDCLELTCIHHKKMVPKYGWSAGNSRLIYLD